MADAVGVGKLFPQDPVQVLGVDLEHALSCIQVGCYCLAFSDKRQAKWGLPQGGGTPPAPLHVDSAVCREPSSGEWLSMQSLSSQVEWALFPAFPPRDLRA